MIGRARVKSRQSSSLSESDESRQTDGPGLNHISNGANGINQNGNGRHRATVSAGMQAVSVAERGGMTRRNYFDLGINTRETMAHVKDDKKGSSGTPLKIVSNLFHFDISRDWQLYQYRVVFSPEIESVRLRFALLYSHTDLLGKARAFDGITLFLARKLDNKVTEVTSEKRDGQAVKITITLQHQLPASSPVCVQFFNITFKKVLKMLSMHQVGRHYYNPADPVHIPQHKLVLWPGFSSSLMNYEAGLALSADISHKVLRNDTVLDFMNDLYNRTSDDRRFTETCTKELVGQIVLTRYNNKTYRIEDIDFSVNPTHTFKKAGTEISYVDYYKEQYDVKVHDLGQPMLVSQLKSKLPNKNAEPRMVHILPELCFLTGLSSQAKSDFRLMKDLASETQLTPPCRQQRLLRLVDSIQRNKEACLELENWKMLLGKQVTVTGRVVPSEKILTFDQTCHPATAADWSREIRNVKIIESQPLNDWLMVYSSRNADVAEKLFNCLQKVASGIGFRIEFPRLVQVDEGLSSVFRALSAHIRPDTQLVLCILSSNQKSNYDAIKKFLCLDRPVPSQCVLARTLNKQNMMMSVATKIALQMNCKLGGELWTVEIPLKSLMVIGIDVNRDGLDKRHTVVGFVANTNGRFTRWYSRCVIQTTNVEIGDCLRVCMQGALRCWYEINHSLPNRIVIYRDGVGDGQLQLLVEYEVPQVLSSLQEHSPDYRPKLSVVVVRKRGIPRIFLEDNGKLQNPPLGTVVDSGITRSEWYDFYLVSQVARQGTVNPTYYNVVFDTNGLKPDHMQRLTYKMCHLYYNWPGVIAIPAPCQYAHKLTFLVGQSIHREPSVQLSSKLFYL
ncbi:piwi-like protein 4 [Protopterus annectens]|uniref:Piwi Like RNA-Mediated Gene Silencing 4 n=1 Tax=Protopterus annectens TaxID=7888 RepID=A0A1W1ELL4_PROAN|nr:piwi-like protein 4 [Protopterus annectens]SIP62987.1 Piwi Like RNA-Mediated Gene Silencing 4 [Protopterus annectens]